MKPMLTAAAACPGPNGDQEPSNSPSSRADEIRCHWGPDSKQYFFSREQFDAACDFLCRVWDITELKREQKETLECLFQGRDTLSLLPTGYGKTLSFEGLVLLFDYLFNGDQRLPGRLRPSDPAFCNPVLVVISPLTQLILRQVARR